MRTIMLAGVSAFLACGTAQAVQTATDVSTAYTIQIIQDAATGLGLTSEVSTTDEGNKFVVIHLEEGVVFAALNNCAKTADHGNCKGMEYLARYANKNVPLSVINQENDDQNFIQAFARNGTTMATRSEWQPYGFVVRNVGVTMHDFIGLASEFAGKLDTAGQGASLRTPGQNPSAMASTPTSSNTPNYLDREHVAFAPKDGVINPKSAP